MTVRLPHRVVVLVSKSGAILTHFATDRVVFPAIATFDRDRVFMLAFAGALSSLEGMRIPGGTIVQGALYKETETWRISARSIDKPKPRKRRRKTATILRFPCRMGGGA